MVARTQAGALIGRYAVLYTGQAGQHSDPGGHESQAAPDVLGGSRVTAAEAAQHRGSVPHVGPASQRRRAGARDSAGGRV